MALGEIGDPKAEMALQKAILYDHKHEVRDVAQVAIKKLAAPPGHGESASGTGDDDHRAGLAQRVAPAVLLLARGFVQPAARAQLRPASAKRDRASDLASRQEHASPPPEPDPLGDLAAGQPAAVDSSRGVTEIAPSGGSRHDRSRPSPWLLLATAIFLIISSMVGGGILSTSGYVALEVGSHELCCPLDRGRAARGVRGHTLAELSASLPRSGGEFVILSEAYGPLVGFLGGWVSLVMGFIAPIAATASAASELPARPLAARRPDFVRLVGSAAIALFAIAHATGSRAPVGSRGSSRPQPWWRWSG